MVQKPVVVRNEHFGLLIWSPQLDRYLLPNSEVIDDIRLVIDRKKENDFGSQLYIGLDADLVSDLVKIGFDGLVREINNPMMGRLSAPLDVYFDHTFACNLHCSYCYNKDVDRGVTMSDRNISVVLTQLAEAGVMRTHLAGGEPMINPRSFKLYLETARQLGMNVSITCNGTRLTERTLGAVFDNDVAALTFSLDGHTAEAHDAYRGRGNFEITRTAARKAVQKKRQELRGPKLQYKLVYMFDTPLEQLEGATQVAISDGLDTMQFRNPEKCTDHDQGHYGRQDVIEGSYQRIRFIDELQKKYGNRIEIWTVWNPIRGSGEIGIPGLAGCIGAQELIAIGADGTITPCSINKLSLGNILSDWDGNFARFWRESPMLKSFQGAISQVDPYCASCDVYSQCRGGSKVRVVVQNRPTNSSEPIHLEDLAGRDPMCPVDYISGHPELTMPLGRDYGALRRHRPVIVAHSL